MVVCVNTDVWARVGKFWFTRGDMNKKNLSKSLCCQRKPIKHDTLILYRVYQLPLFRPSWCQTCTNIPVVQWLLTQISMCVLQQGLSCFLVKAYALLRVLQNILQQQYENFCLCGCMGAPLQLYIGLKANNKRAPL